jgi:REP element-mobilizing transposase RayT
VKDDPKIYSKVHPEFITVTCLEWKALLEDDRHKDIITSSLDFLVNQKRVAIYAFVIMHNHFNLIWQMLGEHQREDVQRDFLKSIPVFADSVFSTLRE